MFSLRVATPLTQGDPPTPLIDLTNAVTGGSFTTALPAGYANASLTLKPGWRDPLPDGAHLAIYPMTGEAKGGVCWEGQRRRPTYAGRDLVGVEASGYALTLSDADMLSTAQLKSTTEQQLAAGDILRYTQAQIAPLLRFGPVWDSPAVYHPLSMFDGRNLWEVAGQLGTESGFDWCVWANREASFTQRVAPAQPDYLIAVADCPQWELDDSAIYTRITVAYTDSTGGAAAVTPTQIDYAAEARRGVVRHKVVQGGTTDESGAVAYARTTLRNSVTPTLRATIGPVTRLRGYYGDATPGYAVQAGQWVQIGGQGEQRGTTVIVQTSCDWVTGAVTLQLGAPLLDTAGRLAHLATAVQYVKGGTNPNTLARV